ncbi:MAG TPA: translation initiation factor IF-2 [Spirochaetota bacterium]|nr:translation initiation factor IF-2 [Spirochaetota bacterium]HOT19781.1 translation initiation factor IF-2 [Spirochaetota bacterium]HPD05028.1 translation initiation factor IF-2 [Spirochaetota bacterium]HQK06734.1 translation initiation factor IF-2 [Spirochaetota bacterium]HRR61127.1 translation initiation factor IF-2 [Spirochaetota bacterium]
MKAIDVATKNHVSTDDVIKICKELGIPCDNEQSDLHNDDVFLIEKKIQIIKEHRAQEAKKLIQQAELKKKIKLKRKVHVAKELKKETDGKGETVIHEGTDARKKAEVKTAEPSKQGRDEHKDGQRKNEKFERKDRQGKPFNKFYKKDGKKDDQKLKHGGLEQKPEKPSAQPLHDKKDVAVIDKEVVDLQKRQKDKGKEKEKEKDKDKRLLKKEKAEFDEKLSLLKRKKEALPREAVTPREIEITETITVGDLAKKMNIKASEVIAKLMSMGVMATINQVIDADTASILAGEYGTEVKVVSLYEETVIRAEEEDRPEDYVLRPPIVTVMGHVDHGKTKLLDAIRTTNVVDTEHGGITQHIGAYRVKVGEKYVTFLDTPGHEAFTTMRARGASVTDIVVLVVAADDGVMPQTIEAINHAKAANVPIIVAINKIDLPEANPGRVKQELTTYELIPEEWGGTTLFAEISAKQKININELLDLILIQAEMLELKANPALKAKGVVIESKLDPGRGPIATVLVQNGTLRVGDPFVVGLYSGRVRAMFADTGEQVYEATPSMPVEVLGISGVPSAGDPFQVVESEKYARQIAQKRQELVRLESAQKVKKVTLEDLNAMIKEGEIKELKIVIKADVDGSVQALRDSLQKLSTNDIRVKVIHAATGGINESDVMLASASNAIIIGYQVRPSSKVAEIADKENVSIQYYNIIYDAIADVKAAMEGMLSPEMKEEITSTGEIKQTFKISKVGTIAGAVVLTGRLKRSDKIRLLRDSVVVFDGKLNSLKRFKNDAGEVEAGQECGFTLENFNDIKEGDTFESYQIIEIKKKLGDNSRK